MRGQNRRFGGGSVIGFGALPWGSGWGSLGRASGDGAGMLVTEKSELHSVRGTASVSTAYGEDCQRNACAQVDTLSEAGKL